MDLFDKKVLALFESLNKNDVRYIVVGVLQQTFTATNVIRGMLISGLKKHPLTEKI